MTHYPSETAEKVRARTRGLGDDVRRCWFDGPPDEGHIDSLGDRVSDTTLRFIAHYGWTVFMRSHVPAPYTAIIKVVGSTATADGDVRLQPSYYAAILTSF